MNYIEKIALAANNRDGVYENIKKIVSDVVNIIAVAQEAINKGFIKGDDFNNRFFQFDPNVNNLCFDISENNKVVNLSTFNIGVTKNGTILLNNNSLDDVKNFVENYPQFKKDFYHYIDSII